MKQFVLTLDWREPDGKFKSVDKIEGDDLVQLVCQFNLVILVIQRKLNEENRRTDDDIPF